MKRNQILATLISVVVPSALLLAQQGTHEAERRKKDADSRGKRPRWTVEALANEG